MKNKKTIQNAVINESAVSTEAVMNQTVADFKNSALVVSLVVNAYILTTWLVLQVTDQFNAQIITYLQK